MKSKDKGNITPTVIMRNAYAVYPSFAMLAGMQLDVFSPFKDGPMDVDSLAHALDVDAARLSPLVHALAAAGLLTVQGGIFANTAEADCFLVRGRPNYLGGLSGFYGKLWNAALNTAESIRTGKPKLKIDWDNLSEEEVADFFRAQGHSSMRAGRELAEKLDFSKTRRLLDAGGGVGGAAIGICGKHPSLRATVADLPKIIPTAERFIHEAGLSGRIDTAGVDLCSAAPDGPYDAAILRAFIQILSREKAEAALKHIGRSMPPGARLYVIGSILEDSRLSPPSSLGMGLVFLNFYDEGRAYTEGEHSEMLTAAGFTDIAVEHEALVDGMGIVSARKGEAV